MQQPNQAAWLLSAGANPLEIGPAPYTQPGPKQLVVRTSFVAINPLDWAKQFVGNRRWDHIPYPHVLGEDVAGTVVDIGDEVTRFKIGDRIIAHAVGFYAYGARAAEGAFQKYTIVREHMASPIPDTLSMDKACVIPMCCSAAACALFQKTHMALEYPRVPAAPANNQWVLITGASTAVGSNGIQLACAAGYQVVTTCSPRSFEQAKRLGASLVYDYNNPLLEAEMTKDLQGKRIAGAFAIGAGSVELCVAVLGAQGSACRKYVVKASFPWPKSDLKETEYDAYMQWVDGWNRKIAERAKALGVETTYVEGAELGRNEVSTAIYKDFLPAALAAGQYIPAPEPRVIGKGLEFVQMGLDVQKKGVSATKIVIQLE